MKWKLNCEILFNKADEDDTELMIDHQREFCRELLKLLGITQWRNALWILSQFQVLSEIYPAVQGRLNRIELWEETDHKSLTFQVQTRLQWLFKDLKDTKSQSILNELVPLIPTVFHD